MLMQIFIGETTIVIDLSIRALCWMIQKEVFNFYDGTEVIISVAHNM